MDFSYLKCFQMETLFKFTATEEYSSSTIDLVYQVKND